MYIYIRALTATLGARNPYLAVKLCYGLVELLLLLGQILLVETEQLLALLVLLLQAYGHQRLRGQQEHLNRT